MGITNTCSDVLVSLLDKALCNFLVYYIYNYLPVVHVYSENKLVCDDDESFS